MYYFSASKKGIFIEVQKQLDPKTFPSDAKPISKELRDQLVLMLSKGGLLSSDASGNPIVIDQPELTIEEQLKAKTEEINQAYDNLMRELTASVPAQEIYTWERQLADAKELQINPDAEAIALRTLAAAREVDIKELVSKVLSKAHLFAIGSHCITGYRQKLEDQLSSIDLTKAKAVDKIKAITFDLTLDLVAKILGGSHE